MTLIVLPTSLPKHRYFLLLGITVVINIIPMPENRL